MMKYNTNDMNLKSQFDKIETDVFDSIFKLLIEKMELYSRYYILKIGI